VALLLLAHALGGLMLAQHGLRLRQEGGIALGHGSFLLVFIFGVIAELYREVTSLTAFGGPRVREEDAQRPTAGHPG